MLGTASVCGTQLLHPDPASVLRLVLLAPLLEEWIVRAGMQEWLMRRYPGHGALALLAPAAFFSLLHLGAGPANAAWILIPGLALGLLYLRWRDWRLCALVHALFNTFALTACGLTFN
jgi:uncharacterized protein